MQISWTTRPSIGPYSAYPSTPAGMEFQQAIIAPSFALKLNENHSIGVALQFVFQELMARGMQHFDDPLFTTDPGFVTNRGKDHAQGLTNSVTM